MCMCIYEYVRMFKPNKSKTKSKTKTSKRMNNRKNKQKQASKQKVITTQTTSAKLAVNVLVAKACLALGSHLERYIHDCRSGQ